MSFRLLFVCTGNICRSPTAEAVMRHVVATAGLSALIDVDSAGTGDWHVGEPPDERSQATAAKRGLSMPGRARRFVRDDFARFDLVLALDLSHKTALDRMAHSQTEREKIRLLRDFEPRAGRDAEVPDPYYGNIDGFEEVYAICERACAGLLEHVRARLTETR